MTHPSLIFSLIFVTRICGLDGCVTFVILPHGCGVESCLSVITAASRSSFRVGIRVGRLIPVKLPGAVSHVTCRQPHRAHPHGSR
jgi:hypothetical protein